MSVDIATLGIRVDASQVDPAATKLDKLGVAGTNAEKSIGGLTGASGLLMNAMSGLGIITTVEAAVGFLSTALTKSVGAAKEFSRAMGEISTLVDTTKWSMGDLSEEIKKQAAAFGSNAGLQSAAMYEIISSGATDAADATEQLTYANKLAVAGMTTVAVGADGLTSVINAYGKDALSAKDASDSMFTAMLYGKLKIEDLASGLGNVAPIAQTLGVSFDELTASVAALTKGGVSSSTAINGVRAILATVAKPSEEAAKLADKLGINFDSAGLKAMGFAGFMEHVKEKTNGNTDAMAILFGGVEALVPALNLTGKAGEAFAEIMGEMANKADATDEALAKINATPAQQLNVIMASLGVTALNVGQSILNFFAPAIESLAGLLSGATEPGATLNAVLTALGVTAGALAIRAIVGMTGALVALITRTVAANGVLLLFQMNLARYGVAAALATTATNVLAAAKARLLLLMGGPIGVALAAVAGGLYLLHRANKDTSLSTEVLAKKTGATTEQLQAMRDRADKATRAEDQLAANARAAARDMGLGARQASIFAQKLTQLGIAAQFAAANIAKKNLAEARAAVTTATTALYTSPEVGGNMSGKLGGDATNPYKKPRDQAALAAAQGNLRQASTMANQAADDLRAALNPVKMGVAPPMPTMDLDTSTPKADKKGGGAKADKADKISDAQRAQEEAIKTAKEYAESLKEETSLIGKNNIETKMMAAEKAALAAPSGLPLLAAAIRNEAAAWKEATIAQANADFKRDYKDQAEQIEFETSQIGLNTFQVERGNIQRAIDIRIRDAQRNGIPLDIALIEAETKALLDNVDARENMGKPAEAAKAIADSMRDARDSVRDLTDGFGELFGTAGEGFSNLINTLFEYSTAQAEIGEQQAAIQSKYLEGQAMSASDTAEYARLDQEAARNKVASYGQMLGAAKSFFKEGSTGYKILEGAERAYRLFQFAMQAKAIIMDVLQTGSSVANSGTRAAASGVEAVAKAMASLPPPFNFIAAGAVIAFLVAMGVKMVGGGKGGGAGKGASTTEKAVEAYKGPRDEYGAPTSGYSVLKPGATTVAPGNAVGGGSSGFGTSVAIAGTTLIVQGSLDSATLPQVEAMLNNSRQQTVEETRQVVANDIAARGNRQRIGG